MNAIRIAILEDDKEEEKATISFLERYFLENNISFSYVSKNDPNEYLKLDFSSFDLALIDILMPFEINGFEVSKRIRENNKNIAIMFLTKSPNYAVDGYEVGAINYILKPITYEDFSLKIASFIKSLNEKGPKIHAFKCKDSIIKIPETDIIYIDIYKHYLNIHTKNQIYVSRGNIKDIEKQLTDIFSRCSNYCIINFSYLEEIKKDDVIMNNKEILKITLKYKKQFLNNFSKYLLKNG